MAAPFICLCGASNCIHVVPRRAFPAAPTLEQHYLNGHIREQVVELLNSTELHLKKPEQVKVSR